jgi:3-oxoadipate enol-lactonase
MPYIKNSDNEELYFEVVSSENPTHTILFLHEYDSSSKIFKYLVNEFRNHYQLILFDIIGHGNSDKPELLYKKNFFQQTLKDIDVLLDHLNITEPIGLIGYGLFGGGIAQQMAINKPNHINFLILLNPGIFKMEYYFQYIFWNLIPQFSRVQFNALPRKFVENLIDRTLPHLLKALDIKIEDEPEQLIEIKKDELRVLINKLFESYIDSIMIEVPTLIITGELDIFAPRYMSKFLEDQIESAKLLVVTMAGHQGILDRHEKYSEHIQQFLNSIHG